MEYIAHVYEANNDLPCGDYHIRMCFEKKAHISYGPGGVDDSANLCGLGWSVGPCDWSCAPKPEEVPEEIHQDLTAFLADFTPRSGSTEPQAPYDAHEEWVQSWRGKEGDWAIDPEWD